MVKTRILEKEGYSQAIPGFVCSQPWGSREATSVCGQSYQKNYKIPSALKKRKRSMRQGKGT